MRVAVTCQLCGERMRLERTVTEPGRIFLMCHGCETPLKMDISEESLTKPSKNPFAYFAST